MSKKRGNYNTSEENSTSDFNFGKTHFLGIGINQYRHIRNLDYAVKDVMNVSQVIMDNFEFNSFKFLIDQEATRAAILNQLETYTAQGGIGEDDALVLYFSGHGEIINKRGYWVPHDAKPRDVSSFVPNVQILDVLKHAVCRHVLLISDSCFSGLLLTRKTMEEVQNDTAMQLYSRKSRMVMTSGGDEPVLDGHGNSPFAAALLSELRNNRQSLLVTNALFPRIQNITRYNATQLPQYEPVFGAGHMGGQFVFRKKGYRPNRGEMQQVVIGPTRRTEPNPIESMDSNRGVPIAETPPVGNQGAADKSPSTTDTAALRAELQDMVANAEVGKAIDKFLKYAQAERLDLANSVLQLSGRWKRIRKQDLGGLIGGSDLRQEEAKVTYALLEYIGEI